MQGLLIALALIVLLAAAALALQWWRNRPPDLGAPVYPRSTIERSIENTEDQITTHYVIAPATRDELFDFYESRAADCSEGMCFDELACGTYYAFIGGTTQGVTRYALEIRKEGCGQ